MNINNWILVTGGTGFIGFALTKRLISLGYKVRVVSRQDEYSSDFQYLLDNTSRSQFAVYKADICNAQQLEGLFSDVDYVFHAAALVNSVMPYAEFHRSNVLGTQNICQLCRKNSVKKLIYISTSDVFGLPDKNEIFTETSHYKYWSEPYADTKIEATKLVKQISEDEIQTTIIYPGWVYGPGDNAFIPSILHQLKSGILPIWDRGKFNISFVYIDDLIDVLILTLTNESTKNEDFLILDENSKTNLKELSLLLAQLFNLNFKSFPIPYSFAYALGWSSQKLYQYKLTKSLIMSTTDVNSFGHAFRFSTSKGRVLLDWKIKTPLEIGLSKWKEWSLDRKDQQPLFQRGIFAK
jgi:nucleoside-diphosphate-sugar epimerase